VWGAKVGVQVSRKELHTHIYLDYVIVEFLSSIKKKSKFFGYFFINIKLKVFEALYFL